MLLSAMALCNSICVFKFHIATHPLWSVLFRSIPFHSVLCCAAIYNKQHGMPEARSLSVHLPATATLYDIFGFLLKRLQQTIEPR